MTFSSNQHFFHIKETLFTFSTSKSSTFAFKLFRPFGILTNLLVPSLLTSASNATKSVLDPKLDTSTPVATLNSILVA